MEMFDSAELLNQHQLRPTLARIAVLDLFKDSQSYTPEQAYRVLLRQGSDVSLATMYRALGQLVDVGLLSRQQLDNGPGHYFLTGANACEHMLCTECGALLPMPGPELAGMLKRFAAKHGYLLGDYSVAMQGTCTECAKKKSEPAKVQHARFKRPQLAVARALAK